MWEPRRLTTLWDFTSCYKDSFTFLSSITAHSLNSWMPYEEPLWRISHESLTNLGLISTLSESLLSYYYLNGSMLRPTFSRPVYLGIKHPSGAYDQIFITVRQLRVCWCWALSDERMGLSFTIAADPRQRTHSRVRVPWDSRSYFTVWDSRLPFSSPSTNRRATVEVFDPASTRRYYLNSESELLYDWRFTANQVVLANWFHELAGFYNC
jgi:hypothetical protein